jgi:hypothetical protein
MLSAMNSRTVGVSRRFIACSLVATMLAGCGSNPQDQERVARQEQEISQLQFENEALPKARAENEEVQRLRRENQDLPKLRNQYQEMSRLQKENEQLAQQLARVSPRAAADAGPLPGVAAGAPGAIPGQPSPTATAGEDEGLVPQDMPIEEGDEILVSPQELGQVLPGFDWENLERKEPIGVRALLEKDGFQLTNVLQLQELGLTNFIIQRVKPQSPAPPAPPPQN